MEHLITNQEVLGSIPRQLSTSGTSSGVDRDGRIELLACCFYLDLVYIDRGTWVELNLRLIRPPEVGRQSHDPVQVVKVNPGSIATNLLA
jgi:hypothetical protein